LTMKRRSSNGKPQLQQQQQATGQLAAAAAPVVDYCLVAAAAAAVFANSLDGDFVYDDHQAIVANPDVISSSFSLLNDFWGGPINSKGSHKSWRPLTTLSFRANYLLHGLQPLGFHIINVVLHTICTLLVMKLSERMIRGRVARLFSALLFAVHPIHCEAVAGIVGRADLMAAVCVLAGLLLKHTLPSICALTVVGVACKETAIVLPVLVGVRSIIERRKASSMFPLLLLTFLLCTGRLALQSFEKPMFSPADNPIAHHPSSIVRTLSFLTLPVLHLWMLIYPKTLSFDWSMDAVPPVLTPIDHRFILSLTVYGILATVARKALREASNLSRDDTYPHRLLFSLCLLVLPHALLSSNLLTYVGFVLAERILYLPSVGFCLLAGLVVERARKNFPSHSSSLLFILPVILAPMASRTLTRNEDWRDELRLFQSAIHINPAKALANMGHVLARRGRSAHAEDAYTRALRHRPTMAETHYNLGVLYSERGDPSAAVGYYQQAIRLRRSFGVAHLNLGIALKSLGRTTEAMAAFAACSRVDAAGSKAAVTQRIALASCALNRGSMLAERGDHHQAIEAFEQALSFAPPTFTSLPSVWTMLGESYAAVGMDRQAESCYDSALLADPHHSPALITRAQLRMRQNRTRDAWELLERAVTVAPRSATVHFHLGVALIRAGEVGRARSELELAIGYGERMTEAYLALATLERGERHNDRAEQVLRKLTNFTRTSTVLSTLAAQLHLNEKYSEAEQLYNEALALDPTDAIARENSEKLRRILRNKRS
ncbi:hypothetical protein PFISCL1PPCAC_9485, partial [Pristionchus fissidentatus]